MINLTSYFLAIIILGLIVWQRGGDERGKESQVGRTLLIAGLIFMSLQATVHLAFAIGEVAGGDINGLGHLIPIIAIVLLGLLAWRRPLEGGVVVFVLGIFVLAYFGLEGVMITWTLPVAGALFIIGTVLDRRATIHGAGHSL
jgi:hypothetical protein